MNFTLTYDGPLATNGRSSQKHDIRLALHPQLRELWDGPPLQELLVSDISPTDSIVGGRAFRSIVHPRWHFEAELDIMLLRPQNPGGIIRRGGDIDNRLKTLFDALARPAHNHDVPANWVPKTAEEPTCCLLEDDGLIRSVSVETDRLLAAKSPTHVKLIIRVQVRTSRIFGGLAIWA